MKPLESSTSRVADRDIFPAVRSWRVWSYFGGHPDDQSGAPCGKIRSRCEGNPGNVGWRGEIGRIPKPPSEEREFRGVSLCKRRAVVMQWVCSGRVVKEQE